MALSNKPRDVLLVLRAYYFLSYAGLGSLFPFLPLLFARRGFGPREIAWLMTVVPAMTLIVPPLWGLLADALHARLQLLRVACAGSGLAALLLLPRVGIAGSIAVMAVIALFRTPISGLADAATVDALRGKDAHFSRIRVWGSLGFAIFALLLGLLGASSRPVALLLITAAIYTAAALSTLPLRAPPFERQPQVARELGRRLVQPRIVLLLVGNTLHYVGQSTYDAYFGLHARALGFDDSFVGVAWAVGVSAEILVMLSGQWLLSRIAAQKLLVAAALAGTIRWLALAALKTWTGLVVLQALHGMTFGLWILALVSYVQSDAPPALRTSLQSSVYACLGLGTIAGYLLGGEAFARYGGSAAFELAAIASAAGALCYLGLSRFRDRRGGEPATAPLAT